MGSEKVSWISKNSSRWINISKLEIENLNSQKSLHWNGHKLKLILKQRFPNNTTSMRATLFNFSQFPQPTFWVRRRTILVPYGLRKAANVCNHQHQTQKNGWDAAGADLPCKNCCLMSRSWEEALPCWWLSLCWWSSPAWWSGWGGRGWWWWWWGWWSGWGGCVPSLLSFSVHVKLSPCDADQNF